MKIVTTEIQIPDSQMFHNSTLPYKIRKKYLYLPYMDVEPYLIFRQTYINRRSGPSIPASIPPTLRLIQ